MMMGGVGYLVTVMVKMVLVATLVPEREWLLELGGGEVVGGEVVEEVGRVRVLQEVLKHLFNLLDLVGLYWVMRVSKSGKEVKVVGSGLGWSAALNLFSRFLPLFFGARQLEFSWKHTLSSLEANLSLVCLLLHLSLTLFLTNLV